MILVIRRRVDQRTSHARRCRKEFSIFWTIYWNEWKIWIRQKSWVFHENYTGQKNPKFFWLNFEFVSSETDRIRGNRNDRTVQRSSLQNVSFGIFDLINFARSESHPRNVSEVQVPNSRNRPFTVLGEFSYFFRNGRVLRTISQNREFDTAFAISRCGESRNQGAPNEKV